MKRIGLYLFLVTLLMPFSSMLGQTGYFSLGFPSSKYPFPVNMPSDRVNPGIATGSSSGLYMRFGEDIAKLCSFYGISLNSEDPNRYRFPKFRVNVYATQGGFDSVKRLRYEREVQLAIVQSDLRYFADQREEDEYDSRKREAWRQISDDIKLVLPLYKEKVHILVRPSDKATFKDLAGLLRSGATVNVGTISSGGMITCTMIEEIITGSRSWKTNGFGTWRRTYYPQDAALDMLLGKNPRGDSVDAVILVGGVPYPALKNYGLNWAVTKGLFKSGVKSTPELALLPVGDEAQDLLGQSDFGGYHPTEIMMQDYEFMGDESAEMINTVGVYSCLVTHRAYTDESKQSHKINWVRHILFRILTKLDPQGEFGLPHDFGPPKAGNKWKEVGTPVAGLTTETKWEELYGWPRHEDPILRKMIDVWAKGNTSPSVIDNGAIIDPIELF